MSQDINIGDSHNWHRRSWKDEENIYQDKVCGGKKMKCFTCCSFQQKNFIDFYLTNIIDHLL